MNNSLLYILLGAAVVMLAAAVIIQALRASSWRKDAASRSDFERLASALEVARREILEAQRQGAAETRRDQGENMSALRTELGTKLSDQAVQNEQKLENIRVTMETRIRTLQEDNGKQLDEMRRMVETRMRTMQEDNTRQLDKMRAVVDEKLQKTLEERIGQSFRLVTERLEEVHKGLGEMQNLAAGVGDLKKVLSGVKTRGILGEYQLAAILEEILPREQYETNVSVKRGSRENVEFAIRLPGDGDGPVYLPIDSKFPVESYYRLADAYESGDAAAVAAAGRELKAAITKSAGDICSKYINPPNTTNFAIMFLPSEGLYAEVIRQGLLEELQAKYRVNIAGPTTMAALLSSLQMGFSTLSIQKSSNEVAKILGAVKKEFATFEDVLNKARQNIQQVDKNLETLVGVRTRKINTRLKTIDTLPLADARVILGENEALPFLPEEADSDEAGSDEAGSDEADRDV